MNEWSKSLVTLTLRAIAHFDEELVEADVALVVNERASASNRLQHDALDARLDGNLLRDPVIEASVYEHKQYFTRTNQ